MTAYLHARNVGLELPIDLHSDTHGRTGTLRSTLGGRERLYRKILSGIDFRAEEGDRIGLLGLNGAGKTTLLRVLNGAFPPTWGRIERQGSTQSLLNPVLGFDEYATVVENAYLRGTAMGLRRAQLRAVLDDILLFAGLTEKAGHPLYTLSSGQRMRLGFALSTAIQPDILLMDEWLSTGDAAFLERAQQRMRSRFNGSRIVFMASHSPALVRILCNKAIVLEDGRMRFFGAVEDALQDYRAVVSGASAAMRAQIAELDPLLFGDCSGVVERVRRDGDALEIEGWAVSERGGEIGIVCVEVDGNRALIGQFERVEREDVRNYLGRTRGRYGFRVRLGDAWTLTDGLMQRMRLSVGSSASMLSAPLTVAQGANIEI